MSDRRDFPRKAAIIAAGVASQTASAQQQRANIPLDRVNSVLDAFGVRYPIFCAGMGGAAGAALAIAVSNGG